MNERGIATHVPRERETLETDARTYTNGWILAYIELYAHMCRDVCNPMSCDAMQCCAIKCSGLQSPVMHAILCACMYGHIDACMYACMDGCDHAFTDACIDAEMTGCLNICIFRVE